MEILSFVYYSSIIINRPIITADAVYSQILMTRTSLGPWVFVLDMRSSGD